VIATTYMAHAQLLMGDFADAVRTVRSALELMSESKTAIESKTGALSTLSESLRALGDHAAAVEAGREAVEVARRQPHIAEGVRAQTVLGEALIAASQNGGPDPWNEVEACLDGARQWLEESGARGMLPRVNALEERLASL
jgi:hypothetical protein